MFPEKEVLQKWVDEEPARKVAIQAKLEAEKETKIPKVASDLKKNEASTNVYPELGFATDTTSSSTPRDDTTTSNNHSAAAGQMFLGVAVTGFIMSNKRVKKYVEKKLKKNK